MKFPIRQLPTIQNWSCHRSGDCCRDYLVSVTAEEKKCIEGQRWKERPEFSDTELFTPMGTIWKREYRLSHRADGSCVFLDENGLCRIHAQYGEQAKPLACQLYPYMIVPAGKELRVSVRFSCPSVVRNLGRPVSQQSREISRYAAQLVPLMASAPKPPLLRPGQRVDWPDLLRIVDTFEEIISESDSNLPLRLARAVSFARQLEGTRADTLGRSQLHELLTILKEGVRAQSGPAILPTEPCEKWALTLFRLLVAQCARKDLSPHLQRGLRGRLALLRAAWSFRRGYGLIPQLQPIFGHVNFSEVERPFGSIPAEASQIMERYYLVKVQGLQFFGRAYYNVPLIEGLYSLVLTFPTILWIARWLAAGAGRTDLYTEDIVRSLTVVDHQWGFTPVLGFGYARWRVRILASHGQIERLIIRYGTRLQDAS